MARAEPRAPSADDHLVEMAPVCFDDEKIIMGDWLLANAEVIPWKELVGGKLILSDGTRPAIVEVVVRARHEPLIHVRSEQDAKGQVSRYNLEPFRTRRFEAVLVSEVQAEVVTAPVHRAEALRVLAEEEFQRAEERRLIEARQRAEEDAKAEKHRQEEARRQSEQRRIKARRRKEDTAKAEKSRRQEARREEEQQRHREAVERLRVNASRQFDLLLFDLDDTLLETGCLEGFRGKATLSPQGSDYLPALLERSEKVRSVIGQEALELLRERFPDMSIGVFSRAPRVYVDALLDAFYPRIRWDCVVAYEDVGGPTKPAPNGILRAMSLTDVQDAGRVAVVGDDSVDVLAAYQAGAVAVVLTEAWGERWSRNRGDPNRTRHFRTLDWLPDAVLEDPMELPSAVVDPWASLPALEAWDRCEQLGGDPSGRVAKINHFHPTADMEWVSCHVLGRYFSIHSNRYDFAPRRRAHSVTRRILDAKDGQDYPESWVSCCRWYVLELARDPFAATRPMIVCPVPARAERSQRLERLLDRLREHLSVAGGVVVDNEILRFSMGARANKELDRIHRFRNIEEHLTVAKKEAVAGATVVVVDDITTTGATFYYADRYLRHAGAASVHCVALTQTIS